MKYIPIKKAEAGMVVAQDITAPNSSMILARRGVSLTPYYIEKIRSHGILTIGITDEKEPPAGNAGSGTLPAGNAGSGTPPAGNAGSGTLPAGNTGSGTPPAGNARPGIPPPKPVIPGELRDDALNCLSDVFSAVAVNKHGIRESARVFKQMDKVVVRLVDSIVSEKNVNVNITGLKSYDEYTFHHSLSVTVLAVATAQKLRLKNADIQRVAKSAMLHDIGKTAIPLEITNKTSRLTENEFGIMKSHSLAGFNYLSGGLVDDEKIRYAVLCHHEKFDGTGYPLGIAGQRIPLWARIISAADVYDALTSARPYRKPMQPAEALEFILGGSDSAFDYQIVSEFAKALDLYPVGSMVELSNGQSAVVIKSSYPMRPVVMLINTGETIDLFNDEKFLNIVIKRLLPE